MAQRTAHAPKRPLIPTSAHTHAILSELAARPHVQGCFIGLRRKNGRDTRTLALVCTVREKLPRTRVSRDDLIPRSIAWPANSRETATLRTDVQEGGESGFQAVSAGPGDLLEGVASMAVTATVGVALRHPRFGPVVTTAGHAVQDGPGTLEFSEGQRPTVRLRNVAADGSRTALTGVLLRSSRILQADYALIGVEAATPVLNLYHDVNSLGGLHVAQPEDVGKPFFALTAGGVLPTTVRGVSGVFDIGGFPMRDLILTDAVTQGGDSGCALIDASFRVAGLLVGFTTVEGERRSVFMSAFWALALESSELL
jgi:hypothetical protein